MFGRTERVLLPTITDAVNDSLYMSTWCRLVAPLARLTHGVLLPMEARLNVYVNDTLVALLGTIRSGHGHTLRAAVATSDRGR